MKASELAILALALVAVAVVVKASKGAAGANGWRTNADGTKLDPSGNWWWGNQMIWKAPEAIQAATQEQVFTEPVWL